MISPCFSEWNVQYSSWGSRADAYQEERGGGNAQGNKQTYKFKANGHDTLLNRSLLTQTVGRAFGFILEQFSFCHSILKIVRRTRILATLLLEMVLTRLNVLFPCRRSRGQDTLLVKWEIHIFGNQDYMRRENQENAKKGSVDHDMILTMYLNTTELEVFFRILFIVWAFPWF